MAWRIALACLVLAAVPHGASANGRPPAAVSITFRQGQETDVVVGLTFGLVISHDGGKAWSWMCEDAIGYKGTYDPWFAFSQSGALFATTFAGLKVARDGCTFGATPAGATFASVNALGPGPDHAFYYAAVQAADEARGVAADFNVYKSIDDGMTFPDAAKGTPAAAVNWWQSLAVAQSDTQRLYLSGYSYLPDPAGGTVRQLLLFRSDDGGKAWIPLPTTAFAFLSNSVIHIAGITKDDADHLYVRVEDYDNLNHDAIYRSSDKGLTWQQIKTKDAPIGAFAVRAARNRDAKHDLILGTQEAGAEVSHDDGETWAPLANAPHMSCLVENAAGELWACTQNYGFSSVPSDGAGIMKTTDLVTWTKVLRYQDLTEVVTCAAGTIQKDTCAASWCAVCAQLGCTPSLSYGCPVASEAPVRGGGCCETGAGSAGALALGLSVGMVLRRPRRRREY
jgi:hypothetical protein